MAKRMEVTVASPICPDCVGFGARQNIGSQAPCETCQGKGRLPIEVEFTEMEICPTCHGTGQVEVGKPESPVVVPVP